MSDVFRVFMAQMQSGDQSAERHGRNASKASDELGAVATPSLAADGFGPGPLRALGERIVASGALGRSQTYERLLNYLIDASINGETPRELDIALGALGRDDRFDVTADSAVRVAIHQLRKKLSAYYAEHEPAAELCLVLPKGRHSLYAEAKPRAAIDDSLTTNALPNAAPNALPNAAMPGENRSPARLASLFTWNSLSLNTALLVVAIVLLAGNLLRSGAPETQRVNAVASIAGHPLWASVLADDKPLLIVMGDYYIFGELSANGNVARMVREFNVNSSTDLEELRFSDIEHTENYLDLDLSYMPEGSAFALARIVPLLQQSGKVINMTMMSDLTTADIRANHLVYIGYISALERLANMAFAGSGLTIGRSYDELIELETQRYFTSDAGLPEQGEPFRDYGFFSSFPASRDTQVILVAGMRDAGLMHMAQALSETESLDELLVSIDNDTDEALASLEALYEVYGIDRMNFDAKLVYSHLLETGNLWGAGSNEE